MSFSTFVRDTVVRQRAGVTTDRYGAESETWEPDKISSETIPGWVIQPVDSSETFDAAGGRNLARWRAYGPIDADVLEKDRIVWDGMDFDIDGAPLPRRSKSGRINHLEVMLKRRGRP